MTTSVAVLFVVAFASLVKCEEEPQPVRLTFRKFTDATNRAATPDQLGNDCKGGYRFWVNGDVSHIRLEDPNGKYVGSHTGFYEEDVRKALLAQGVNEAQIEKTIQWYKNNAQVQQEVIGGKNAFLMTSYVTDPSTVCEGTSDDRTTYLYVYHKGAPDGFRKVNRTLDEEDLKEDGWVKNPCVPMMGTHYRHRAGESADFDCKYWTPAFLIFDGKENVGWGFNFPGLIVHRRFENAAREPFNNAMKPMPTCVTQDFDDNGGYSSMHTYLIANPQNIGCPAE